MENRQLFDISSLVREETDFAKKLSKSKNLQDFIQNQYEMLPDTELSSTLFRQSIENKDQMIAEIQLARSMEVYRQTHRANDEKTNCNNMYEIANMFRKMGKYQEAIVYYKKAQSFNSSKHEALIKNKLLELQDHDEPALLSVVEQAEKVQTAESNWFALSCYNKLLILKPNDPTYLNNRAATLNLLGSYKTAIQSAENSILANKNFPNPWRHLGNAYFGLKNYRQAYESYQQALKLNNNYKEAWVSLGDVCVIQEKYTEAVYAYQKALALDASLSQAEKGINYIISAKKPIDFYKMLTDAIFLDLPEHVEKALRNCNNNIAHQQGEFKKNSAHLAAKLGRRTCLQILLKHDADFFNKTLSNTRDEANQTPLHYAAYYAHTECVKLLIKHNAKVNSVCTLDQTPLHNAALAYRLSNNNVDDTLDCIYHLLSHNADLYCVNKNGKTARTFAVQGGKSWERVVKYIDKVIFEHADDLSKKACEFSNKNLHAAAIKKYEEALDLLPNDPALWSDKAYEHNILGEYQKAKECANRAINMDHGLAYPVRHLGNAHYALEEYESALTCYRKALKLKNGQYPEAKQNEYDCIDRLNEIELVKLIKSKIENYYNDLSEKLERMTFRGVTFFYNKSLCDKKLEQAKSLIMGLTYIKREAVALQLLSNYIELDRKLENSFEKDPADFTALLNDIINTIDKLRKSIELNSIYQKRNDYTYSSYFNY